MKPKTRNRIRGSISLLLVIILLPMMTFSGLVVDMSRLNMARSMVSSAGDLTMNSALANYDTILKDVYGLFAMTQQEDIENGTLEAELEGYFQRTLVGYGVVDEENAEDYVEKVIGDFGEIIDSTLTEERSDFLEMEIVEKSFSVNKLEASSLAKPDILRKHIVEYSKYRAPIGFGLSFLDSLKAFQTVDDQNDVVESQVVAQESSQHVTQACQKLINLIREYDELVEAINSGNKAAKGKDSNTDGLEVNITDDNVNPTNAYHLQVDKYRDTWNKNYSVINRYNLIFFANAPSVDSVYLKDLDYATRQIFIKLNGEGLLYNGSGISMNPTLGQNTDAAEQQLRTQMGILNNTSGPEYTVGSSYAITMNPSLLNWDYTKFSDENSAFEAFNAFEKFLLDQSSGVNYSQVKSTLEQIFLLGKYYDNYYTYKSADVEAARQAMNTAVGNLSAADRTRSTAINNITSRLNSIRNAANALVNPEDEEDALNLSVLSGDVYSRVSGYLYGTPGLPGMKNVEGYNHYNFDGWIASNFEINGSNKYHTTFRDVCTSKAGNAVADAASGFLDSGNGNFYSYMSGQLGDKFDSMDNVYRILKFLYDAGNEIGNFSSWVSQYNGTISNYAYLQNEVIRTTQIYNQEQRELTDMQTGYNLTLSFYRPFVNRYQEDVYYYTRYIQTAQNVIAEHAKPINEQFTQIKTNIKSLIDKLAAIDAQMTNTRTAIETYQNNVDQWEEDNNAYVSKNESDTFSKQNEASIENAKNEYNLDSFDSLKNYVTAIKKEYQDFYDILTDGTHYKYGSAKIDTINSATETAAAVASIKSSLPAVVDLTKAMEMFATLYPEYTTPSLEPGQLCFLKTKVLPIQILKYLNETFPKPPEGSSTGSTGNSGGSGSSSGSSGKTQSEQDYDKLKSDSQNGYKADTDDVNSGKFGYTYAKKSAKNAASKGSLPSGGKGPEEKQNTEFKLSSSTDDDGNETVNASNSYKQQADTTSTLLTGLSTALTAGLENLYILNYIYENFSYNTIVQEAIVEEMDLAKLSPATSLVDVGTKIDGVDYTDELYTNKLRTLSNYHINGNNNYLYGAEAEYILFGQPSAKTNVNLAKGSIYALRFGFNCIYAFTDSEIRNTARTIGLGVQAATLGIVPYQLVMIVVQLAITAAESAIDLKMMDCGLRVAVIKTDDTWVTKVSSFINIAGDVVQTVASNAVEHLMTKLQDGLQSVVDAGMDKMDDAIYDLTDNLQSATEKALNDLIDSAFAFALEKIEAKLNELQYIEYVDAYGNALTTLQAESDRIFGELKTTLPAELDAKFANVELASLLLPSVKAQVVEYINEAQQFTNDAIKTLPTEGEIDPGAHIVSLMNDIKMKLISRCDYYIQKLAETVAEKATEKLQGVKADLESKIGAYTEETLEDVKEQIQQTTNDYINTVLDTSNNSTIGDSINNPGGSTNNNVASMVRFGYKDYLMLFTYLKICLDDDATLKRIADLIQMNIQNNSGEFKHAKGKEFLMSNANTYVSIGADVKVDMLLLDLDIFSGLLTTEGVSLDSQFDKVSTITYRGLYGY